MPETADHADEMIEMQNKLNDAIVEINKLTRVTSKSLCNRFSEQVLLDILTERNGS